MISGTPFLIVAWDDVAPKVARRIAKVATATEIEQLAAQCRAEQAMCLLHPDGVGGVELVPHGEFLELWVRLAAGFRPGALSPNQSPTGPPSAAGG